VPVGGEQSPLYFAIASGYARNSIKGMRTIECRSLWASSKMLDPEMIRVSWGWYSSPSCFLPLSYEGRVFRRRACYISLVATDSGLVLPTVRSPPIRPPAPPAFRPARTLWTSADRWRMSSARDGIADVKTGGCPTGPVWCLSRFNMPYASL